MNRVIGIILGVILILACLPNYIYTIAKVIQFEANCGDYLVLSADANNIDTAEKHLTTAINYLEENDLTEGYTKIFVYYPKNDIGLWYENLKTAQEQLQEMQGKNDVTELEESNMLMKLRETILSDSDCVTHPIGISIAENYTLLFWLNCLMWILPLIGIILMYVYATEY